MINAAMTRESIKEQTAILILAYADYESLELALATHAKFTVDSGLPIYILQNGRGTYDTERTFAVGRRYQTLFPNTIKVISHIPPQKPYFAIRQLFEDSIFSKYKYVIKLDDDVMVLTPDWVDKLIDCYVQSHESVGDQLAYVTSLVNNNPFGFKKLIELCDDLSQEYFAKLARPHLIGAFPHDSFNPYRIVSKDAVHAGCCGTIWRLPYLARWIHERTTKHPEYYINISKNYEIAEVNPKERYSINCVMCEKKLWTDVDDGGSDDEHMLQVYSILNKKKIFADLSIPMVHLAFFSQRDEVRDMIPGIRDVYTNFLSLPFPIAQCSDRAIEIENRLRFMENNIQKSRLPVSKGLVQKFRGGIQCYREHGLAYTANRMLVHLHLKRE